MNVHVIKLYNEFYLYDAYTNSIIKITKGIYDFFTQKNANTNLNNIDKQGLSYLKTMGILSQDQKSFRIQHSETDILADLYENNLKSIILQLTQNCNLRCKYCVYSGSYSNRVHNNKRMDWNIAQRAIDFLLAHSSANPRITIGFYGGEPLLEFELIKKCVLYAENIFKGKELLFNMTTNGTLLTEEMILFFYKHGFHITISLDGPKSVQNTNRVLADNETGSFEAVIDNLKMIKNIAPQLCDSISFNSVIDLKNNVEEINEFFLSYEVVNDIFVRASFINSNGKKSKSEFDKECYIVSQYETFKTYLFYCSDIFKEYKPKLMNNIMENLKKELYNRTIIKPQGTATISVSGQCLPGLQRFFVNADGDFFPCERVNEASADYCIGSIDQGFCIEKAAKILNVAELTSQECEKCWNVKLCGQCVAMAEDNGKITREMRLKKCEGTKSSSDEHIKDFIVLKKYGCNFEKRDVYEIRKNSNLSVQQ